MKHTLTNLISSLAEKPELNDSRVLEAIARVRREAFLPFHLAEYAYADVALPLTHGATISQPYIVAFMTTAARIQPGERVLEIGTGSGYQAAVLREMGAVVFSVECVKELADDARKRLDLLGYDNISVRFGNGREGWPEAAPFNAVMVTAASEDIPPAIVDQLAVGGRLLIPIGDDLQHLKVYNKTEAGLEIEAHIPVRFVRLRTEPDDCSMD